MLFPGCRIKIVESTVKGTTGPLPGSIGFVSEYRPSFNLVELNKVVWYRYGKTGKARLETGNFTAVIKEGFPPPKLGRRSGTIEVIRRGSVQKMDILEFLCWAFSILRLKKTEWEFKEMRQMLSQQFEIELHKFTPIKPNNLILNQYIDSIAGRSAMTNICRRMRDMYYKGQLRRIRHDIDILGTIIKKDLKTLWKKNDTKFTPESYAAAARTNTLGTGNIHRYISFFNMFNHDAFLYPRAEHLCRKNEWVLEIVKQYKKVSLAE